MKKSFTLAEILVTLAIIGVVAAITIPSAIRNFQKQDLYARFINTYNIFNNVYLQLKAANIIDTQSPDVNAIYQEILNRTRHTVKCNSNDKTCFGKSVNSNVLNNLTKTKNGFKFDKMYPLYELSNGANFQFVYGRMVTVGFNLRVVNMLVDTNGINRGPNVLGRDLFKFYFLPWQASIIVGDIAYLYNPFTIPSGKIQLRSDSYYGEPIVERYCNFRLTNFEENGQSCGLKLLREGKMNY